MTKSKVFKRNARQTACNMWLDTESVKSNAYLKLLTTICVEVDSSFSLAVLIHLRSDDILGMIAFSKSVSPHNYDEHQSTKYLMDAQISGLIKKYKGHVGLDLDPEIECAKKFIGAELLCRETNDSFQYGSFYDNERHNSIMARAKVIIAEILGDIEDVDLTGVKFGSGRTYGVKSDVSEFFKLNGPLEVTKEAKPLFTNLLVNNPGWLSPFMEIPHSVTEISDMITTVPGDLYSSTEKDATTNRPLGIPPIGNALMCKSVGTHFRKRYKRVTGIDIMTAQRSHKRVVQAASISGRIATIDLVSASDTIALLLVMHLIPYDWFNLLDTIRSHRYAVIRKDDNGKEISRNWYEYEKFSAMGCAFTFELESIIFYAICKATMDEDSVRGLLSVYGDDILIPTQAFEAITQVLPAFGFGVNTQKSFGTGLFRESCGSDFHNGTNVRPFFLKDVLNPRVLVLWHNSWIRSGHRHLYPHTFSLIRKCIPGVYFDLISGPLGSDDDTFIIDESLPSNLVYNTMRVKSKSKLVDVNFRGVLPLLLYRMEQCSHQYLRGRRDGLVVKVRDATRPLVEKTYSRDDVERLNLDVRAGTYFEIPSVDLDSITLAATQRQQKINLSRHRVSVGVKSSLSV